MIACSEYVDETAELVKFYTGSDATATAATPLPVSPGVVSPVNSLSLATTVPSDDIVSTTQGSAQSIWSPQSPQTTPAISSSIKRRRTYSGDEQSSHTGPFLDQPSLIQLPDHHSDRLAAAADGSNIGSIASLLQTAELNATLTPGPEPAALNSAADAFSHGHAIGHVSPPGAQHTIGLQEACLMRYFVDHLACWVSRRVP